MLARSVVKPDLLRELKERKRVSCCLKEPHSIRRLEKFSKAPLSICDNGAPSKNLKK